MTLKGACFMSCCKDCDGMYIHNFVVSKFIIKNYTPLTQIVVKKIYVSFISLSSIWESQHFRDEAGGSRERNYKIHMVDK